MWLLIVLLATNDRPCDDNDDADEADSGPVLTINYSVSSLLFLSIYLLLLDGPKNQHTHTDVPDRSRYHLAHILLSILRTLHFAIIRTAIIYTNFDICTEFIINFFNFVKFKLVFACH